MGLRALSRRDAMASPAAPIAAPEATSKPQAVSAEGLRVALYSGNYNSVRDGANKALNRLVAHLIDRGATVRVYAPFDPERWFEAPGEIVEVPSRPIPTRGEYRVSFGLPKSVRADIEAFRPDVIHVSVPDLTAWQAQTLARHLGIPVVGSLHTLFETYLDYYGFGFLRPLGERYLDKFYSRCDLVLAPSAVLADNVRRRSGVPAAIWSRGVDRAFFNSAHRDETWRQAHGFGPGEVAIAFFGRLVLEKGTADVMVNPSVTEAFGNVNLEAMAAGLAVVGADVPVVRSMVDDGRTGLLADPASATDFADKIERLLVDAPLRHALAANARQAAERYDWIAILDSVVADYLALVKGGGRDAG
jgi:glycosyltransferase involved in cell wall biosynthesis